MCFKFQHIKSKGISIPLFSVTSKELKCDANNSIDYHVNLKAYLNIMREYK